MLLVRGVPGQASVRPWRTVSCSSVGGWAAAGGGVIMAGWWLAVTVMLTVVGRREALETVGAMLFMVFYWWGVMTTVGVTISQWLLLGALAGYVWRLNREVAVMGTVLAGLYLPVSVVIGYIRLLALRYAGQVNGVDGSWEAVPLARLMEVVNWVQGNPYTTSYGLGLPTNLLFGAAIIMFAVGMLGAGRSSFTAGAFLFAGGLLGLGGSLLAFIEPELFGAVMAGAGVLMMVAFFALAGMFWRTGSPVIGQPPVRCTMGRVSTGGET